MHLQGSESTSSAEIKLRLRLPIFWLFVCLVAAFVLPSRVWNTLLIGIGGQFLIAYLWAKMMAKGLSGSREIRFGWVAVGDMLEEHFVLTNNAPLPALWVEIVDQANVPGYRPATVRSVPERGMVRWRETAVCQQRGQYALGPWQLRTSDPFGIFMVTHHYPISNEIIIHPPIHTNIPIPLPSGKNSGSMRAQQTIQQATLNASTVRDYQPGDPYRWIHWPTAARRNQLYVKSFDLDAAGAIWICLDLRPSTQLGEGLEGTEEHAVALAAALAAQAIHQNRPIGLATYGRIPQIVPPGLGAEQRWRILRSLALVRADSQIKLETALLDLQSMTQQGTAVMLITADHETNWVPQIVSMQRRGAQMYTALLNRTSFGGEPENHTLAQDLQRLGVQVHHVQQGELKLAPQEINNNFKFVVTGTGKVVLNNK